MKKSTYYGDKKMKQRNRVVKICGVVLAAVMTASVAGLSACTAKESIFAVPKSELPTEDKFALNKYDYDELSHIQTTVRADVENVLERNLPRAQTELLSDDFSIVYNTQTKVLSAEYGIVSNSATQKTATISFNKYPAPNLIGSGMLNGESAGYGAGVSCNGSGAFSNGDMDGQTVAANNGKFYKYMLITQGQHLTAEAAARSANGTLTQEWLKKHPAADAQYGAVLGDDNAVKKEIALDPLYRTYHDTGLYLPAGEAVTVKVEGLKAGEYITVELGVQDSLAWRGGADDASFNAIAGSYGAVKAISSDAYFTKADVLVANNKLDKISLQNQWNNQNARLPWLHARFTLNQNREYTIGTPFGGLMQIGMGNCYSRVKTTITGAVESPHYVLGQTTPEKFDKYLRNAPGVIAILDTENGQLIGPTGEMGTKNFMRQIKTDEVDKLAMLWHSFFSVNESFTGGTYNRFNKTMFDWHVPAGAAVALGNYSFAHPTGWFNGAMNYRGLLSSGTWGILHEIGHNHGSAYGKTWGFNCGQEGEVRNNALILLSYILFCDIGTTIRNGGGAEHGEYANPYNTLRETISKKGRYADTNNCGYFEILGMYANIMHSFGAEKFYELLYTYKTAPSYCSNLRADFAYRCAKVYGMNFIKYFNDFYTAKIAESMFSEEQFKEMKALPNYEPVSCFYAGGIDGVKTSGDYIVAFGEDVKFDLLEKTICTLDTADAKGFKIIGVNQPDHGSIRSLGNGSWAYSFDKYYTGTTDEFTFDVKLADGIVHRLQITLRITYNGARLTAYNDVQGKDFDEIFADVASKKPNAVTGINTPNINTYQTASGKKDVRVAEFYWKAPMSGEISISAKWDDWAKIYFGNGFDSLEEIITGTHDIGSYKEYNVTRTVEKGKFYAVRIFNVNTGGGGSASVAVKNEGGAYVQLNSVDIFHPDYPLGQTAAKYVYEPQFLVSKKDGINLSSTGTDKGEWRVVSAPTNISDGRYIRENMVDETTGDVTVFETDKWGWLVDGQTNTIFHTAWQAKDGIKPPTAENPDIFIIDTEKIQPFNYFTITTRLTQNDDARITSYELLISDDNVNYRTVSSGDTLAYVNTNGTKVANLKFDKVVSGRYWKLVVKGTSGRNYTIISELDTGVRSTTQQVISPTSNKLFTTGGWKNSAEIDSLPNGYLISNNKNEKLVIKFVGESIGLYGVTGEGFGSADIYIDGKKVSSVNLDSDIEESRKLIFYYDNLKNKEHTVEIITTSSDRVMLSLIGIPYSANLINAANIYKERALTIALVVFVLLFVAVLALVVVLVFVPKFRNLCFGNRFIKKLDEMERKPKAEKKPKSEKKPKAEKKEEPEKVTVKTQETPKTPAKKASEKQVPPPQKAPEKKPSPAQKTPEKQATGATKTVSVKAPAKKPAQPKK